VVVEDVLARARVLADLGRDEEAERLLAQALAQDPENADGLALRARVLVAMHRFEEAHAADEQLLRAHPDNLRGLLSMARVKCLLQRKPEGVPFARRAVELHPDSVPALTTLADVLSQVTHGSAEALAVLRRALELSPESAYAHRLTGEIHVDLRQYAEAERWLLRALAISPQDPWAILQLGLARAGLGRFGESRDQVAATLRLDATPAMIGQVVEYIEAGGLPGHLSEIYQMALAALGRTDVSRAGAAGSDPELLAIQGKLAWRMYSREADEAGHRKAGELAAAVLAADPGNPDARYVRARVLCDEDRCAEALPAAEQLQAEGYPHAHMALTVAYSGTRDYAAMLAVARQQLARNPGYVMYRRAEAHALRCLGRYGEALAAAKRAAELSPSVPEVQLQLGLAAREAGDLVLGEQALRAAVADAPGKGCPAAELALLLATGGRWAEAEVLLAPLNLNLDLPDVGTVAQPCLKIIVCIADQFGPRLGDILADDERSLDDLAECAHWLRLLLSMYTLALAGQPEVARGTVAGVLRLVDVLRKVPAPPDSAFAAATSGLGALLDAHGAAPPDPSDAGRTGGAGGQGRP
jgi:tetratricopeptide (TPR) repeat protein